MGVANLNAGPMCVMLRHAILFDPLTSIHVHLKGIVCTRLHTYLKWKTFRVNDSFGGPEIQTFLKGKFLKTILLHPCTPQKLFENGNVMLM